MKKTAILMAFAAMAITASAASINWSISGAPAGVAREYDGVTIAANTSIKTSNILLDLHNVFNLFRFHLKLFANR